MYYWNINFLLPILLYITVIPCQRCLTVSLKIGSKVPEKSEQHCTGLLLFDFLLVLCLGNRI